MEPGSLKTTYCRPEFIKSSLITLNQFNEVFEMGRKLNNNKQRAAEKEMKNNELNSFCCSLTPFMTIPALISKMYYSRNNKATPATASIEPITSLMLILSLKSIIAGGIIKTGTMAMMVAATPALVF